MKTYAPILLFVYNRPEHLKQLIASLQANAEAAQSMLFIYTDAARNKADEEQVNKVREVIRHIDGFASIEVIERATNWGLARNIIGGVTEQIRRYGRVIVLEDDLVVAP
ncbi:MAG: glycosyltransferase family 2 protein, partial [Bacteroides sp.]|nr:glycosyltransferase family 2 protein [Bacteroides sp.]